MDKAFHLLFSSPVNRRLCLHLAGFAVTVIAFRDRFLEKRKLELIGHELGPARQGG